MSTALRRYIHPATKAPLRPGGAGAVACELTDLRRRVSEQAAEIREQRGKLSEKDRHIEALRLQLKASIDRARKQKEPAA